MNQRIFTTAINCIDGRTQIPVIQYMRKRYDIDYVDMITEPGPIKILTEKKDKTIIESIKRRVEISLLKHGSEHIAVVGHHDCAGNPVVKETQYKQILDSLKIVQSWFPKLEIVGLWIDEKWFAYEVK